MSVPEAVKSTTLNPNPTASLGSPLMTPGWPLASVAASNPAHVAGDSPTPDPTKESRVQKVVRTLGLTGRVS